MFFFEKKNQKTFVSCSFDLSVTRPAARGLKPKFFCFFFFKKRIVFLTLPAPASAPAHNARSLVSGSLAGISL
jgi:hypothetical protein